MIVLNKMGGNHMNRAILASILLAALSIVGGPAAAQQTSDAHMKELAQTDPPIGYTQFCAIFPDDCGPFEAGPARIHLTKEAWKQLVDVNDYVNALVEPATDMELYGVEEWWTYPLENRGDCEDYVLLKRKLLLEKGWPASALLITVARDKHGDGHAVLTVTTSAGDLILDNQDAEVRQWSETPYAYLMRQSKRDPETWVSLRDNRLRPNIPVAGHDNR
jgi:predicted transglutaminase-like cysteine proteinase